jgi:hypothetical protein
VSHQISCPPQAHELSVARWRNGLEKPFQEANTIRHSLGVCLWWRKNRDMAARFRDLDPENIGRAP